MRISATVADAFFALADSGRLPGWCVAIAPVDKLSRVRSGKPCNPTVWIGDGVVLVNPVVRDDLVRFPLGFVESEGEIATDGAMIKVPSIGQAWLLDGEFAILGTDDLIWHSHG